MSVLFASPAAGFDEPFEMLAACHDRVRGSLELLQRLAQHLREHGADSQAREAARDVLRYFTIAAPAHHEDEERHVLPLLRESGDPALMDTALRLHEDHAAMASAWAGLAPRLEAVAEGRFAKADAAALIDAASSFAALYGEHLSVEDSVVFVAAKAATPPQAQRAMGDEMAARRGARRR